MDDGERKRLVRAIWAYSGLDQRDLAERSGVPYNTIRGLLDKAGRAPNTDQALAIADACDVPAGAVLYGLWRDDPELAERVETLSGQLETVTGQLATVSGYVTALRKVATKRVLAAAADAADKESEAGHEGGRQPGRRGASGGGARR